MEIDNNLNVSRYGWSKKVLKKINSQSESKRVADVGCKNDKMKRVVNEFNMDWVGFDRNPENGVVKKCDIEMSKLGGKFDIVMMLDVVEHLNNPWIGMSNISKSIKRGGYLVLTTPNPLWSRSRFHALVKGVPSCFTKSDLKLNHHVFTPWPHIIKKLLTDNEMEIKKYVTIDGKSNIPKDPSGLWYLARVSFAISRMALEYYDKKSCGMSYGLIAQKKMKCKHV